MKARLVRAALSLLVLLALSAGLGMMILYRIGAREKKVASIEQIQGREGIPVEVARPVRTGFVDYFCCDGNVVADVRAALRAKVAEVVEAVHARVGERVNEGQVLVEFRRTDLQEAVAAARTAYREAKNNHERYKVLFEGGVVTQGGFEQAQTAMENAAAALSSAESRLEFTQVRSPIDGVVDERWVEPGEYKGEGKELLTIVDLSTVEVRALVPQQNVAALAVGMKGQIQLESTQGWIAGIVSRIGPATTDPNRLFDVYLKVENPRSESGWLMRPGMYAEVRFVRGTVSDALAVPGNCVIVEGSVRVIYLVEAAMAQVPVDDPPDEIAPEPEDTFVQRIKRGWGRARSGVLRLVQGGKPMDSGRAIRYREAEVHKARRTTVVIGLRERQLVQLVNASLSEESLVIVNPREAIRDGVLVRMAEGGAGQ